METETTMGLFAPIIELTRTITVQPLFCHEQVLVLGAKEIVCHQIYSYYKTYMLHNNQHMDIAFSLQWDLQVQSGISWVNFNHRVQSDCSSKVTGTGSLLEYFPSEQVVTRNWSQLQHVH